MSTITTSLLQAASTIPQPTKTTFLSKVSTFLDQAAPIVQKTQQVISSLQNRVPGTNIPLQSGYNPSLQYQQPGSGSNMKPVLIIGGAALLGFLIYKAVK